jgi:hypothetical protein
MTIIEQARELLSTVPYNSHIAALCRALIARDEALREIRGHAAFRAFDENDASCLRGQLLTIVDTADLALADDGKQERATAKG